PASLCFVCRRLSVRRCRMSTPFPVPYMRCVMKSLAKLAALVVVAGVFLVAVLAAPDGKIPELKFEEVKEIAPGVFFRYSSIIATDPKVPFGGCNETWIVC